MEAQTIRSTERARPTRRRLFSIVMLWAWSTIFGISLSYSAIGQTDGGSSLSSGGPLLAGGTAGIPEGGGGAVAGALAIADASTGIAHSSVAFRLETARGRVQPTLGLSYSSSDGQREAGIGWGLNIASIERHNDAGGPQYKNDPRTGGAVSKSTDRFTFGGSPLVPICLVDQTGKCRGAITGEVMPSWAKSGWNYFRLEVDSSYERFFWSPDHKTWRVQTKSGETREYGAPTYGSSSESGIDKDSTGGLFRWNLVRRYDAMNNANEIVYVWQQLNDPIIGTSPIGSLTDIYDTSLPAAPSSLGSFAHHTQLIWQVDPSTIPSSLQPRVFRVRPSFRLAQVNVWSAGFEAGSGRALVRSYALSYYAPGTQSIQYARSLLKSVQMIGACPNVADSGNALSLTLSCATLPATTFTYKSAAASTAWKTMSGTVPANSTFVDLDGDGYPDAVIGVGAGNLRPRFARNLRGEGFAGASALPFWHNSAGTLQPYVNNFASNGAYTDNAFSFGNWAQVTGPGTDGFFSGSNQLGPSGFYVPQKYQGVLAVIDTTYRPAPTEPRCATPDQDTLGNYLNGTADLDGDGIPDCWSISVNPGPDSTASYWPPNYALTTMDANGSPHPFAARNVPSNSGGIVLPFILSFQLNYPFTQAFTAQLIDVTGDGIPDLVYFWNKFSLGTSTNSDKPPPVLFDAYFTVFAGNGDGTFGGGFTMRAPACASNAQTLAGQWPLSCVLALIDLNGDGYADLVTMDAVSTTITLSTGVTSNGIQWGKTYTFPAAPFSTTAIPAEIYGPEAVDLNASGVLDLVSISVSNPPPNPTGFEVGTVSYIDLLSGEPPPLLETISDGLGATTTITYGSTASLGAEAASSGHPWGATSTQSMHVVTGITTEVAGNPAAGGPFVTTFEYQGASSDAYAGAMYDKRFRRFNGFGFVRSKLTDQANPGIYDVTDTYFEPSLSTITESADVPWDAIKGLPVFSTRYAAANGSTITQPLSSSHTTYKISRLYTGIDGRIVRQVVPETADSWLYDAAKPLQAGSATSPSLKDVDDVSGGAVSVSAARNYGLLPWVCSHLQSSASVDEFGNMTASNDSGVVGSDKVISRSSTWVAADGVWNWCPKQVSVKYTNDATNRQFDYTCNKVGEITKITGNLSGTLVLRSDPRRIGRHLAGAVSNPINASPRSDSALVLVEMNYDPTYGNLITSSAGAGLRTVSYQYDPYYQQLVTQISTMVDPSGTSGSTILHNSLVYDRGFEVPTQVTDASSSLTVSSYDLFGRITSVHLPDPDQANAADTQSDVTVAYTDVPGGPFQRVDSIRNLGTVVRDRIPFRQRSQRTIYTDAMGNVAAVLSSGGAQDPAGAWIVSGLNQRDARGAIIKSYESFFSSLTNGSPGANPPALPHGTAFYSMTRDPFERATRTYDLDGSLLSQLVYHDLSQDTYDFNDALVAEIGAPPTYSTIVRDGHGRPIESDQHTANAGGADGKGPDTVSSKVSYLATGEITSVTRSSAQQGVLYTRWMQYDSLGRMVLNAEPNTSSGFVAGPVTNGSVPAGLKAWMYAYDAIGDLVGTSDARGCGINFTYDGVGRETSEDYIPCTADQPAHTAPNLATGAGAEVFNVYDSYQPGGAPSSPFLVGKLAATYSRGEHTVYSYDGRGRVTSVVRQLPKPPGASDAPVFPGAAVNNYAPTAYQFAISYDVADRPIAQSTGASAPELQGIAVNVSGAASGGTSVITTEYDTRNIPTVISGSYGPLAVAEQRDSDGRLLSRSYGDLAGTVATYTYDGRNRLQTASVSRAKAPPLWATSVPGYAAPNGTSGAAYTTPLILQKLGYSYDPVSNPVLISDSRTTAEWPGSAGPISATLGYDDLYRLKSVGYALAPSESSAQLPPFVPGDLAPISFQAPAQRSKSQTFGYDNMGNVTSSNDDAVAMFQRSAGTATYGSLISGGVVGPNQLARSVSDGGSYSTTYDAAGNLTSISADLPGMDSNRSNLENVTTRKLTLTFQWDEAGHLQQASRTEAQFSLRTGLTGAKTITNNYRYDGNGARTWHSSDDSGSTEYYLDIFPSLRVSGTTWGSHSVPCLPGVRCGPLFQQDDYDVTAKTEQVYLISGSSSYGRLVSDNTLPSPSQQPLHELLEISDPHGSTSSVIDKETSELVEQITYLANAQTETDYRPARWNAFREGFRYTGKYDDYEVGLVYYGARYFVPGIGRWASADPLTIHTLASDLNPYSFVRGSPFRYVDPIGLDGDADTAQCDNLSGACQSGANNDDWNPDNPGPYSVSGTNGVSYAPTGSYGPPAPGPPPPPQPAPGINYHGGSATFSNSTPNWLSTVGGGYSLPRDNTDKNLLFAQNLAIGTAAGALLFVGGEALDAALFKAVVGGAGAGGGAGTVSLGEAVGVGSSVVAAQRIVATDALAQQIQGAVPRGAQTVVLLETAEGPTIAAANSGGLNLDQVRIAQSLGLIPGTAVGPEHHAEINALIMAAQLGLTPTRGVTTNGMCPGCVSEIAGWAAQAGLQLVLSSNGKAFNFPR
jgi:RHS repeat-associated protein